MELDDYLKVFRRHWLAVLAFAIVAVAVAGLISFKQPKVYAANASGFVSTGLSEGAAQRPRSGDTLAKSRATSYVDLAKSRAVARDVARAIGVDTVRRCS